MTESRTSHPRSGAIVVGVGDRSTGALRFAAEQARRRRRPLHLVHVLELPSGEAYVGAYGASLDLARGALAAAEAAAVQLVGGDVSVTTEIVDHGWIVADLVSIGSQAALVVVQQSRLGRLERLVSGSVVHAVAGRATVPVVSVPADWEPARSRAVVTVAVQDPGEAGPLIRLGCEEARAQGSRLVVLHAWWMQSGHDATVVDAAVREDRELHSHRALEPTLADLRSAYPDVAIEISVQHTPPVEAVLGAAERSALLVLGRRHHLLPVGSHLGPVARASLDRAPCPVLVAPENGSEDGRGVPPDEVAAVST
jgi:nucleotide-binding universal stress UspA family protein